MGVSLNNLLRYQEDLAFLDNIVTGDETWVHHINPETKRNSMMWKHPSSPTAKKFKMTASAHKVMATVFWDMKGLLLVYFTHKNETINADHYIQTA
jgi:histone-lysine N-methyltransferase SETMAR